MRKVNNYVSPEDTHKKSFELSEDIIKGKVVQLLNSGQVEGIHSSFNFTDVSNTHLENKDLEEIPNCDHNYIDVARIAIDPFNCYRFAVAYKKASVSGFGCCIGTIDPITYSITLYSEVSESRIDPYNLIDLALSFDLNTRNKLIIVTTRYPTEECCVGTINLDNSITLSNQVIIGSSSGTTWMLSISCDPYHASEFILSYKTDNGYPAAKLISINFETNTITAGIEYTLESNFSYIIPDAYYNSENEVIIASGSRSTKIFVLTSDVVNHTLTIKHTILIMPEVFPNSFIWWGKVFFNGNNCLFSYVDNSNSNLNAKLYTLDYVAGSVTSSGESLILMNYGNWHFPMDIAKTYTENRYVAVCINGDYTIQYKFIFDVNTVTNTIIKSNITSNNLLGEVSGTSYLLATSNITNSPIIYLSGRRNKIISFPILGNNYNRNNIIGILQESGYSGESKEVALLGAIDQNQNNLITNTYYSVSPSGELEEFVSGTSNLLIGKALSENVLLTTESDLFNKTYIV